MCHDLTHLQAFAYAVLSVLDLHCSSPNRYKSQFMFPWGPGQPRHNLLQSLAQYIALSQIVCSSPELWTAFVDPGSGLWKAATIFIEWINQWKHILWKTRVD